MEHGRFCRVFIAGTRPSPLVRVVVYGTVLAAGVVTLGIGAVTLNPALVTAGSALALAVAKSPGFANAVYNLGSSGGAQPPPTFGISLNAPPNHVFASLQHGYAAGSRQALTVTVTNTGNRPTGNLTVTLSGANAGSFTRTPATIPSIPAGSSATFTVTPNRGLPVGTYIATVAVSGGANIQTRSFSVSFAVIGGNVNEQQVQITVYNFPPEFHGGGMALNILSMGTPVARERSAPQIAITTNVPLYNWGALSTPFTNTGAFHVELLIFVPTSNAFQIYGTVVRQPRWRGKYDRFWGFSLAGLRPQK